MTSRSSLPCVSPVSAARSKIATGALRWLRPTTRTLIYLSPSRALSWLRETGPRRRGHRNGAWGCVVPEARRPALCGVRPQRLRRAGRARWTAGFSRGGHRFPGAPGQGGEPDPAPVMALPAGGYAHVRPPLRVEGEDLQLDGQV